MFLTARFDIVHVYNGPGQYVAGADKTICLVRLERLSFVEQVGSGSDLSVRMDSGLDA